jgi:hypothetical protein
MASMDRAALLAACGVRAAEDRDIPGVGRIRLREMSGADRDRYFAALLGAPRVQHQGHEVPNPVGLRALVVAMTLVGPDGAPMFASAEEANAALRPEAIDAIFAVAARLNAIVPEERQEIEGN